MQKNNYIVIRVPLTDYIKLHRTYSCNTVNYIFMFSGFVSRFESCNLHCNCSRQSSLKRFKGMKTSVFGLLHCMYTNLGLSFAAKTVVFVLMKINVTIPLRRLTEPQGVTSVYWQKLNRRNVASLLAMNMRVLMGVPNYPLTTNFAANCQLITIFWPIVN